ncbi:MAG: hypothetical protein QXW35_05675, partial [Candidatus Aenigmatarchaeota archaeon]
MNFWTSDGTVNINNFNNYIDTVVNEIHDIIYDLLKNKANTVELRKALLDIDSFSSIYDQYNYNQEYKPFIYYGLRKYSVLTNFYLPEIQTNNQVDAISPFEAATNVIIEIDDLGFKNITKNRGFELLVHLAAIDTAHKYIIEKTAQDINITEKTELNIVIDELIKDNKNLFVKYKDIYIKYFQFLTQDRVELFNDIYKTDPEGFVKFLNFVFGGEFFKEDVYFLRVSNKLYVIDKRGIQKEIEDDFVRININLLPENVYIPSPYFYVYLDLNVELFIIFERLLFTFINDNNVYPIVINAITYNLTPQEMLQVFILTVYKNIIETLYGIKPVFRKLNNIDTTIIDLYNSIKNNNGDNTNDCFDIFSNCILARLCSENINNNTYFAGRFNREIAGIIQIIVNSSSDILIDIYNSATIDDIKNIAIYLIDLFNYLCSEDLNSDYFNKYSKKTIQQLATYLVDLPYRLFMYLITQKIELYKDHYLYFNDKQILSDILLIRDYYYNINQSCISDCYSKNSTLLYANQDIRSINICNNAGITIKNIQNYEIANNKLCNGITQENSSIDNNNNNL